MRNVFLYAYRDLSCKKTICLAILLCAAAGMAMAQLLPAPNARLSAADYKIVLENPDDEQVFQKFLDKLPTIEGGGPVRRRYFVLEGDMRLTRNGVRAYLRQHIADARKPSNATLKSGEPSIELNVAKVGDVLVKWPFGNRALTYAVNRSSFPSAEKYAFIVEALPSAIAAWTDPCGCGLTISHKTEFDDNPDLGKVTFIVEYAPKEKRYVAVAFFPSDPPDQRYLYVMEPYFTNTDYDKIGMLRHELGHVLGYRHAHIGGVPGCEFYEEGDSNWQPLSNYDPKSVMHYPCGQGGSAKFELSDRDKADHRAHYAN